MTKSVVHYKESPITKIVLGYGAIVFPIDHTSDLVSNTTFVYTSNVIKINKDDFETENSIYKLVE